MDVRELVVGVVEEGGVFSIGFEAMVPVEMEVPASVAEVAVVDVVTGLSVREAVDCTTSLTVCG